MSIYSYTDNIILIKSKFLILFSHLSHPGCNKYLIPYCYKTNIQSSTEKHCYLYIITFRLCFIILNFFLAKVNLLYFLFHSILKHNKYY